MALWRKGRQRSVNWEEVLTISIPDSYPIGAIFGQANIIPPSSPPAIHLKSLIWTCTAFTHIYCIALTSNASPEPAHIALPIPLNCSKSNVYVIPIHIRRCSCSVAPISGDCMLCCAGVVLRWISAAGWSRWLARTVAPSLLTSPGTSHRIQKKVWKESASTSIHLTPQWKYTSRSCIHHNQNPAA